jgi:hypothetical protein
MLNSGENPGRDGGVGRVKAALQVLEGGVNTGGVGNTTAVTVISLHGETALMDPAIVDPQPESSLYRFLNDQQPVVFVSKAFACASVPKALRAPPGGWMAYSGVKPLTDWVSVMSPNLVLQVLAGAVKTGDGNTTKLFVSEHEGADVAYFAVKQPEVVGVKVTLLFGWSTTILVGEPPIVQVPPVDPLWVNVTGTFTQALVVVTIEFVFNTTWGDVNELVHLLPVRESLNGVPSGYNAGSIE